VTARAVDVRAVRAPQRVPGLASTAVRAALTGEPNTGIVLGTSTHAVWAVVGSDVIVVTSRDATRLPNGVEVPADAATGILRSIHHAAPVTVGSGRIRVDGLTVDVARWWDPRPVVGRIDRAALAETIEASPEPSSYPGAPQLLVALARRSPEALATTGAAIIGRGPGLTPESDDLLAGALAATRVFADAVGDHAATEMLDAAARPLTATARARTTALSAALLRCALAGFVAEPAMRMMRALAGRGSLPEARLALERVGDTSGPALAAGVELGVRALVAGPPL